MKRYHLSMYVYRYTCMGVCGSIKSFAASSGNTIAISIMVKSFFWWG